MSQHVISLKTNLLVFAALMILLVATIGVAYLDLGSVGLAIAMIIATTKAVLIILYFMHVRFASRITWIFSSAAFFWLLIMLALSLNDYLTRGWLLIPGK